VRGAHDGGAHDGGRPVHGPPRGHSSLSRFRLLGEIRAAPYAESAR
jgi:hypothetical protein